MQRECGILANWTQKVEEHNNSNPCIGVSRPMPVGTEPLPIRDHNRVGRVIVREERSGRPEDRLGQLRELQQLL